MKKVFDALKKEHDAYMAELVANPVDTGTFAGISLGSSTLTAPQAQYLKQEAMQFQKLQSHSDHSGPERIIIHKNIAFDLMKKWGIKRFQYMDENGNTAALPVYFDKVRTEKLKAEWLLSALTFLYFLVGFFLLPATYTAHPSLGSRLMNGVFLAFMGRFISFVVLEMFKDIFVKRTVLKTLKSDPAAFVNELFHEGCDYPQDRFGTVPVKVSFPEPLYETKVKIQEALRHANTIPEAKPMMCAHVSAIGLSIAEEDLKPKWNDPFVAALTGNFVIIYTDTVYGNIPNEEAFIRDINGLFHSGKKHSVMLEGLGSKN